MGLWFGDSFSAASGMWSSVRFHDDSFPTNHSWHQSECSDVLCIADGRRVIYFRNFLRIVLFGASILKQTNIKLFFRKMEKATYSPLTWELTGIEEILIWKALSLEVEVLWMEEDHLNSSTPSGFRSHTTFWYLQRTWLLSKKFISIICNVYT